MKTKSWAFFNTWREETTTLSFDKGDTVLLPPPCSPGLLLPPSPQTLVPLPSSSSPLPGSLKLSSTSSSSSTREMSVVHETCGNKCWDLLHPAPIAQASKEKIKRTHSEAFLTCLAKCKHKPDSECCSLDLVLTDDPANKNSPLDGQTHLLLRPSW